jgi:hypothetical protein
MTLRALLLAMPADDTGSRDAAHVTIAAMELELALPTDWSVHAAAGAKVVTVPGFALVPDLVLEIQPLMRRRHIASEMLLASTLPVGATLRAIAARPVTAETGWPISLLEADVIGPDGRLLEVRLLAYYAFVVYAGVVLVRAGDRARLTASFDAILAVLRSGRPHFRDRAPAHIGELWDMAATS